MKILDVIKEDHDQFRELLSKLAVLDQGEHMAEERTAIIQKLREEVISHARAEEAVVYNSMRKADAPTDMVYHGFKEHAETEVMIHALAASNAVGLEFKALVEKVQHDLLHHVKEEETDLFPQVREAFTDEDGEKMARVFHQLKAEHMEKSALRNAVGLVENLVAPGSSPDIVKQ